MRDAIERAAGNNALRQQKLDRARAQFGTRPTAGSLISDILSTPERLGIEQERRELQPQIQGLNADRRSALAQAIGGGVNADNFSAAQLQELRGKQLGESFKATATPTRKIIKDAGGFQRDAATGERIFPDAERAPKTPLVTIEDKTESTRNIKSEERRAKTIESIFARADSSRETATQAAIIEENLDSIVAGDGATGPAFGLLTFLNNSAAQFGLDVNLDESASLTAIEAASNKLAVPLTKQLGVNPTDKDFAIIKSTVARAGTSLPANYALVDLTKQAAIRDIGLEAVVESAQERGLGEIELRKELNKFKKNNPLNPAIPLPKDGAAGLKLGKRYTTGRGVFEFDGENMVRVR